MFLDTTTKSLEIILGTAKTTNDMPVTVDYVDMTTTSTLAGGNDTTSNGITAATILAAPAASTQRKVNGITVYNADTAAKVVTIRLNNNATLRPLVTLTLNVGDTLGYTDPKGWFVIDTNGNIKASPINTVLGYAYVNAIEDATNLTGSGSFFLARINAVTSNTTYAGTYAAASVSTIVTGSSCTVDLYFNNTTAYMSSTLTFPSYGTYLVFNIVSASIYLTNYRNQLNAFAIRVA